MKKNCYNLSLVIIILILTTNLRAQLSKEYSTYEELTYPISFGNLEFTNIQRKAGQEVVYRFVKKKHSLDKYPHKAMEAMAWLEILYNEMVKNPKTKKDKDVENIFNIRNQMRKSVGLDRSASAQECIDRYMLFSKLLSFGKLEINEVDENIKSRQELVNNFKSSLGKLKKKYNENISDETEIIKNKDLKQEKIIENISSNTEIEIKENNPIYFEKLTELKRLFDSNLIDENDYKERKKEILDENF